jgi:hypothetical protein
MQNIFERMPPEATERYDEDCQMAEDALNAAQKMAAGPERIAALRRAGQLRFDAYERKWRFKTLWSEETSICCAANHQRSNRVSKTAP